MLCSQRSKLYRFWYGECKEWGISKAKLLKHKTSDRILLLLRKEKTGKVVANRLIIDKPPYCKFR